MKTNFTNYFTSALCAAIILIATGCETESLQEDQFITDTNLTSSKSTSDFYFDLSQECDITNMTDLYAGQNILVGNVTVTVNGDNYEITYNITDDNYCLTSTHLSVVATPEEFPLSKNGNPKNGLFEYSNTHDCISSYTYTVPMAKGDYIAAHAVVNCKTESTVEDVASTLPASVSVCVDDKGVDAIDSYFNITIAPDNALTGVHDAWCIDQDKSLNAGHCFTADVYSSYANNIPDNGDIEKPENLGALNWLINQDFLSQGYTFGEIQRAIWYLIDDSNCVLCEYLGDWDEEKALEILNMALEHTDFVPGCGEDLVVILIPTDNSQLVFVTVPINCEQECEETAWGDGCNFPGNNWATYFKFVLEV